jgi:integrase
MARPPRVRWDERRKGWVSTAIGPVSDKTGRRVGLINRDIGPPTGRDGVRNRAAAELWLAEQLEADRRPGGGQTLADLAELFLDWCAAEGRAERTIAGHVEKLRTFCRARRGLVYYGELPAAQLQAEDLSRWIDARKRDGWGEQYIANVVQSVNACLNWAATPDHDRPEGVRLLPENPFQGVRRPNVPTPPRRYAGPEARDAMVRYARARARRRTVGSLARRFDRLFAVAIQFCLETGCRPDECCRLEWSHIDWSTRTATLRGKSTHRTGRPRVLPLTTGMVRLLRAIERLPGRHPDRVFTHLRRDGKPADLAGTPYTGHSISIKFRHWRDEAIAAGAPIERAGSGRLTLYALRRDLGSDILRLTGSHAESAEVLGHSPSMNARLYASFEERRVVDLAEKVAKARKGSGGE